MSNDVALIARAGGVDQLADLVRVRRSFPGEAVLPDQFYCEFFDFLRGGEVLHQVGDCLPWT
ncbi:hypothetical protein QBL07_000230 (plasmid) [Gordonia rubripertincta]|uniref:hypothetical protein n=1 Tax=Gordonia rubripertincta TaxID=36822 RepID=UPI0039B5713C